MKVPRTPALMAAVGGIPSLFRGLKLCLQTIAFHV